MVGIPEISVSPTSTYVAVVEDIVCPNDARFIKFKLPLSFHNDSRQAKYYYESIKKDQALKVLCCVAFEDYMSTVTDVVEEVMLEKSTIKEQVHRFSPNPTSLGDDMEVRHMLDAWNDEQKSPNTTYAMILRSILYELKRKTEILDQVKGVIKFVDDQEAHKD